MMMNEFSAGLSRVWSKGRILVKIAVIGIITLLLLIPLSMINSVLSERLGRRNNTVSEITSSWGASQTVVGPILQIPYQVRTKVLRERKVNDKVEQIEVEQIQTHRAFFLPEKLVINGSIEPRRLYRGIYDAVVYSGELSLTGSFGPPDWQDLKIDPKDVLWDDAIISLGVTDLRGTRSKLVLQWNQQPFDLTPGTRLSFPTNGVSAALKGSGWTGERVPFALDLTFNGSNDILLAPLGVENQVDIKSPWPDPGFRGAFLPSTRNISGQGFDAQWNVSYYGRSFPQQWVEDKGVKPSQFESSMFGVEFVATVDFYRNIERAIKYGFLFMVLVFTAFFLFEIVSRLNIHPFQYILVGAALCLFYLALLSLSEFLRFGLAYFLAAFASWSMISAYSASVLKSGRKTVIIASLIALIYGVLYVILQLQDFALLVGTIALFIALGAVMFATRQIDWYQDRPSPPPNP